MFPLIHLYNNPMRLENTPLVYLDINTENIIMLLLTLSLILETTRYLV